MYIQLNQEPTLLISSCDNSEKISRKRSRSQLSSEPTPETKKRRISIVSVSKSVGFTRTVQILPTTSATTKSDWISDAEALSFRANVKRDVTVLAQYCRQNRLKDMDQTEYCSVGVERYCCAAATRSQTKVLKEQRVRAVLQQQEAQRAMGISDPEAIRAVAQELSMVAQDRAIELAARLCK